MSDRVPRHLLPIVPGVGLAASALYASTLMRSVGDCAYRYCADVGEYQVGLAVGGTVHYTGYPLYMLLGTPFVRALRALGIAPAAGASLYSLLWEIVAVMGVVLIVARLTRSGWLACGAGCLLTVMRPIWVHGSIPEVYSLSMVIGVTMVWLGLDLHERWSDGKGWVLAFVAGLGVAHHRLMAILLLAVGLWLVPVAYRRKGFWRWLALAIVSFVAGFLPYLDMPLRMWRGTTWHYGRPDTWDGFWSLFWGSEVAGLQKPDLTYAGLLTAAQRVYHILAEELTLPGLLVVVGAIGLAWATCRQRAVLLFMSVALASYLVFSVVLARAVLLEAVLMFPLLLLVVLLALGAAQLPVRWRAWCGIGLCLWGVVLGVRNYPFVTEVTHDPVSVEYVEQFVHLDAPTGAVVMAPWGNRFFALSYAQRVEGRWPTWNIVDHRADLAALASAADGRIYTAADTFHIFKVDWWAARLGTPLRLTSAGPGLVAVSAHPLDRATSAGVPIGAGIRLVRWEVMGPDVEGWMNVTLYWTAVRTPDGDYSTTVRITDREEITAPGDLLFHMDSANPVYGWYPTSRWQPNEVVREDYRARIPTDRFPRTAVVGMYSRDASGNFVDLGFVTLRKVDGEWVTQP